MSTESAEFRHETLDAAGFQLQRVKTLAKVGLYVGGAIAGAQMVITSGGPQDDLRQEIAVFLDDYPKLDDEIVTEAGQYELYSKMTGDGSVVYTPADAGRDAYGESLTGQTENDRRTIFESLLNSDDIDLTEIEQSYNDYIAWDAERRDAANELRPEGWDYSQNKGNYGLMLLFATLGWPTIKLMAVTMGARQARPQKLTQVYSLAEIPRDMHPEWEYNIPPKDVLRSFIKKAALLPPIGSKAVTMEDGRFRNYPGKPACTAEGIARNANENREKYGEVFSHHLTVQGRLPDEFKYAGLAMILNSPYPNKWEEPFYSAHWGSVAPMVHDGGLTQQRLNKNWSRVKGRTDFIQRIYVNFDESKDEETENAENKQLANQAESARMLTEARFYQRAALALHCKEGSAPRKIGKEMQTQLTSVWDSFQGGMQKILEALGVTDFEDIKWFLDKPRKVVGWPDKRFEAGYPPIAEVLKNIEQAREKDEGDLRGVMTRAMDNLSSEVDVILGLSEIDY